MPSPPPSQPAPTRPAARFEVGAEQAGQRIDNFLIKHLKGVPKSRLYRALRGGEVRVNGGRKKAPYQLQVGDQLRIPPIRSTAPTERPAIPPDLLNSMPTLFEDEHLLVVDKPAGLAAHGGSGMRYGLIEALRALRPEAPHLQLAHRLDRETSGCLMVAKSRAALLGLQAQFGAARSLEKYYAALVRGAGPAAVEEISTPLSRRPGQPGTGKKLAARSIFSPRETFIEATPPCALVGIRLLTGRMHQARLHAVAAAGPIAGDQRYGDRPFNHALKQVGLRRLFLHAEGLRLRHPISGARLDLRAPLPAELKQILSHLRHSG